MCRRAIALACLALAMAPQALAAPPARVIADAGAEPDFVAAATLTAQNDLGGWHLAAWVGPVEGSEPRVHDVFARPLGPDGEYAGEPVRVGHAGVAGPPYVIGDGVVIAYREAEEAWVVAWVASTYESGFYRSAVYARAVDFAARPDGPPVRLSDEVVSHTPLGGLTAANDFESGRSLIAWRNGNRIEAHLVDWQGNTLGGKMHLAGPSRYAPSDPAAVARPDGRGFLVAWGGGSSSATLATRISDGGAASRPFRLPLRRGGELALSLSLAADYRNRVAVAWESYTNRDSDGTGVSAQLVSADGRRARSRALLVSRREPFEVWNSRPRITHGGSDDTFTVAWESFEPSTSAPLCGGGGLHFRRIGHDWRPRTARAKRLSQPTDPAGPRRPCGGGDKSEDPTRPWVEGGSDLKGFVALWQSGPYVLSSRR